MSFIHHRSYKMADLYAVVKVPVAPLFLYQGNKLTGHISASAISALNRTMEQHLSTQGHALKYLYPQAKI